MKCLRLVWLLEAGPSNCTEPTPVFRQLPGLLWSPSTDQLGQFPQKTGQVPELHFKASDTFQPPAIPHFAHFISLFILSLLILFPSLCCLPYFLYYTTLLFFVHLFSKCFTVPHLQKQPGSMSSPHQDGCLLLHHINCSFSSICHYILLKECIHFLLSITHH